MVLRITVGVKIYILVLTTNLEFHEFLQEIFTFLEKIGKKKKLIGDNDAIGSFTTVKGTVQPLK